jgi:hypothetical protein
MTQELKLDGNNQDGLVLHRVRRRDLTALLPEERNLRHGGGRGCGDEYEDDAVERERQFSDAGANHRPGTAEWQVFLGRAHLTGNSTFDEKIPRKGLKDKPKRAAINYYDDVLASPNQSAADREPRMNRGSLACSPVPV